MIECLRKEDIHSGDCKDNPSMKMEIIRRENVKDPNDRDANLSHFTKYILIYIIHETYIKI
jgi:hypothetical protein